MSLADEIENYDQRQLTTMLDELTLYKDKKISLCSLGSTIQGLVSCLQDIDAVWKKKVFNLASGLVMIGDFMEYYKRIDKFESEKEQIYVEIIVDDLIKLIEPLIIEEDNLFE